MDNVLLAATPSSIGPLETMRELVLLVVIEPQWFGATGHLTAIRSALARWSGRAAGDAQFSSDLEQVRSQYLTQCREVESLRGTQ